MRWSHSGASLAVAVTGIAGPARRHAGQAGRHGLDRAGSGAAAMPTAEVFHFDGDREAVRRQTVAAALQGLMRLAS